MLIASGLALARPRLTPYLVLAGTTFQSRLFHFNLDVEILVAVTLGLTLRAVLDRRLPKPLPLDISGLAFVGLNVLILLSLVVNLNSANGPQVWLNTQYFLVHSILLIAIFGLLPEGRDWGAEWAIAIGTVAVVLSALRLLEVAGIPVHSAASVARVSILGDTQDPASWNLYSVFLVAALSLLLVRSDRWRVVGYGFALVVVVGLASAESRTSLVIFALVIASLFWLARSTSRRVVLAGLAIAFIGASISPLSGIASKPILLPSISGPGARVDTVTTTVVAPGPVVTSPSPPVDDVPKPGPPPNLVPDWRSVLDRSYYRLEQVINAPTINQGGANYLEILIRAGGHTDRANLEITVNGDLIRSLRESDISEYYSWVVVPLPRQSLNQEPIVVTFQATGSPDSTTNYFALAGVNAYADGVTSSFWTGSAFTKDDMSSDPGAQRGIILAFLNGDVPTLHRFTPSTGPVLDPSLQDRLTLWRAAAAIFLAHPLLGTGFYTFAFAYVRFTSGAVLFQSYANAHSNYFELLSDLGLFGPLLFGLAISAAMVTAGRRALRDLNSIHAAFAAALGAFLVSSLTQTWIADSRIYVFAWATLLLVAFTKKHGPIASATTRVGDP